MRNYDKLEIAAILRACGSTKELMQVARLFYYLWTHWGQEHKYVIMQLCTAREKTFKNPEK